MVMVCKVLSTCVEIVSKNASKHTLYNLIRWTVLSTQSQNNKMHIVAKIRMFEISAGILLGLITTHTLSRQFQNERTALSERSERSTGRKWPLVPTVISESKFDSGIKPATLFLVKPVLPMLHVTMTYLISLIACLQKQHKIKISDDVVALEVLLFEIACSIRPTFQSNCDKIEQLKEEQVIFIYLVIFVCSAG